MAAGAGSTILRVMTPGDVAGVLDVQEPGAVRGLSEVFPQDRHPFPRQAVQERWLREIESPHIDCYVVELGSAVAGFAATRGDEFLHFGIAVEHWGSGLAEVAHDAVLAQLRRKGVRRAWLRVFSANPRGRRFYERLGWKQTGDRTNSSYPPFAELLRYERPLEP